LKTAVKHILEQNGTIELVGTDHLHDNVPAAVVRHLKNFPADRVDFQDLEDLINQAQSSRSTNA
jgi:hypothetical protein